MVPELCPLFTCTWNGGGASMSCKIILLWFQSYTLVYFNWKWRHQCRMDWFVYGSRVIPLFTCNWSRGGINVLWIHSSMVLELCPLFMFFYGSRVMPPVDNYVPCLLVLEEGGINVLWIDSSMVELYPCFYILLWFQCYAPCLLVLEVRVEASMSYGFILLWFQSYAPCLF